VDETRSLAAFHEHFLYIWLEKVFSLDLKDKLILKKFSFYGKSSDCAFCDLMLHATNFADGGNICFWKHHNFLQIIRCC